MRDPELMYPKASNRMAYLKEITGFTFWYRRALDYPALAIGRTNGEVMLRRWRPYFFYCIDNCLYEIEMGFDMDGFGTGNAKNSTNTATSSIMLTILTRVASMRRNDPTIREKGIAIPMIPTRVIRSKC